MQINATQDRGAYDTIRTVKPATKLRANNNYQDMQETYSEHGSLMRLNIKPMRVMMQNNTTLTNEEIEEIMSLSYENLRQPARADTGIHRSEELNDRADNTVICESEESDGTEAIQEPVQELSPDSLPNKDWQGIAFLDKE